MYITRTLKEDIAKGARYFPVVAILGPRQSGKTTLAKHLFPDHVYVSLEESDLRELALNDARTFLELQRSRSEHGIIIDEFQYVPDLLSYIQTIVDKEQKQGYFVLTGSQNFLMNKAITQSLAGRISLHTLLPLSIAELEAHNLLPKNVEQAMYEGLYPAVYAKQIPPDRLYALYIKTYIERDVRELAHVGDLSTFQTFLTLCAERTGQLVNFTELAKLCRISDHTVKRWLTILEASYIVYLLRPYATSVGKRLIKSPKLYFYDPGIVCYLLNIQPDELITHPKRGTIFETLIIADIIKNFYNKGHEPTIHVWQDRDDHEVDCIVTHGRHVIAIEIKSGRTIDASFFAGLKYWKALSPDNAHAESYVVYAGSKDRVTGSREVISWELIDKIMEFLKVKN